MQTRFQTTVALVLLGLAWIAGADPLHADETDSNPVRVGVVGLVHTHVHGILSRSRDRGDIEIVGISEPNAALAERYAKQHRIAPALLFTDLVAMLDQTKPEAVAVFTSTYDHLKVVEICAPRGIHVMVEKPLAVSTEHAEGIAELAGRHKIEVLVNYETTWYRSNQEVYRIVHERQKIGDLRKIVVHDGHQGPIEIGCNEEFLEWLTDPVLNGGGALTDFGCYGANLITWLMKNERPTSVTAITQQMKPDKYPKVEDEATILLTYPKMQGIVQASWNWPYNRKDMEVYGTEGYGAHREGIRCARRIRGAKGRTGATEGIGSAVGRPVRLSCRRGPQSDSTRGSFLIAE